jgi:hypothetical protein
MIDKGFNLVTVGSDARYIASGSKADLEKLKHINLRLWDIENGKRLAEKNNKFDEKFIKLARSVYKENDERSRIKLEINNILNSNIKEVKSHY